MGDEVSPVATSDQRYAALDPRHLLKKVDENFSQKSFLVVEIKLGTFESLSGVIPDVIF